VFKEGLACTILTRTPTAEVGVADCMTVDSIPNINWPDYNLPAPIIPAAPTPILLDTFTAADGTDPTARDMDVHPATAGLNAWRSQDDPTFSNGVIHNNSFTATISDYSTTLGPLVSCSTDGYEAFITDQEYAICVEVQTAVDGFAFGVNASTASSADFQIVLSDSERSALVNDGANSWSSGALAASAGAVKACAFVSAAGVFSFIVDGDVIAESSGVNMPSGVRDISIRLSNRGSAVYENDTVLKSIAAYQGITLSEAIALTV
jgi:hypothetical protein